jgi:hypothetical protein
MISSSNFFWSFSHENSVFEGNVVLGFFGDLDFLSFGDLDFLSFGDLDFLGFFVDLVDFGDFVFGDLDFFGELLVLDPPPVVDGGLVDVPDGALVLSDVPPPVDDGGLVLDVPTLVSDDGALVLSYVPPPVEDGGLVLVA